MDEFNRQLCDERHHKIDILFDKLFTKLDTFTVVLIMTLISAVSGLIMIVVSVLLKR